MLEVVRTALISAVVSAVVTGVGVFSLQTYLRQRNEENAAEKKRLREERKQSAILESRWKHAVGRMFFWLMDAQDKGREHANGYLTEAYKDFNAVEAEQKAFDQKMLAEYTEEGRQ